MTNREEDENPVIDQWVREYCERSAAQFDSTVVVEQLLSEWSLLARRNSDSQAGSSVRQRETGMRWPRWISWGGIVTLGLLLAFFYGRHFSDQTVNAALLLQGVKSAHAGESDYCYRVRFDPDPRYWNPEDKLGGPSRSLLWTRGDRFWADCAIGEITFKLGREANGTVWISPSREKGIRFSNQEENLPRAVTQICQINSMSVPKLMNEVLVDFDLNSRATTDPSGEEHTIIWAQLQPGKTHSLLSHALLEIDHNNILVRLVLWTAQAGKPRGTVAFTLLENDTIDDAQYQLQFHLDPAAVIESQTLPAPDYEPELQAAPAEVGKIEQTASRQVNIIPLNQRSPFCRSGTALRVMSFGFVVRQCLT